MEQKPFIEQKQKQKEFLSLNAPPSCVCQGDTHIFIGTKAGEILSYANGRKHKILRESSSISSVISVKHLLIYGTRKGEIKAWSNGQIFKLSSRHKEIITSFSLLQTEEEIDLYSCSGDKKITQWKLILNNPKKPNRPSLVFLKSLYGPNTSIISSSLSQKEKLLLCTSELSNTIRMFRLEKETQLIFHLPKEYAIISEFLTDSVFASVSSDNVLYLFSTEEEAPVSTYKADKMLSPSSFPTLLKKIDEKHLLLGFSCGSLLLVAADTSSFSLSLSKKLFFPFIPNDLLVTNKSIYLLGGKEEKHNRFLINKEYSNCLTVLSIPQLLAPPAYTQ